MSPGNTQAVLGGIANLNSDSHARANRLAATIAVSDKNHEDKAEKKGDRWCAFDRRVQECTHTMEVH